MFSGFILLKPNRGELLGGDLLAGVEDVAGDVLIVEVAEDKVAACEVEGGAVRVVGRGLG